MSRSCTPIAICAAEYIFVKVSAIGYFAVTVGNVNAADIQKYIEEEELYHQNNEFVISAY